MEKNSSKTTNQMKQSKSAYETLGKFYADEIAAEEDASRRCLERIPLEDIFKWKPHERSMQMGHLAIMVAEIPAWITYIITKGDIDFATWKGAEIKTREQLVEAFDKNMKTAKKALQNVSDKELEKPFSLKRGGEVLSTASKKDSIRSLINHWVHHRGQLTVYMRLNNILVPSIYGPSADEMRW